MEAGEDPIGELEERLRRYPAERYPVQHATAQFHLGVALAEQGELARAEEALATAAQLFDPQALSGEHGKAMNALGSVLRLAGRPAEAAQVLAHAAAAFATAGLRAEQGAACFNLGLVHREAGEPAAAIESFARARGLFEAANAPAHVAAAARELGSAYFIEGDLDAARSALDGSVDMAARAGDMAGAGAAANVLGLVELASDRPREAVGWFTIAADAHPRSLRPEEHAMAKANLALAHEAANETVHARVAARHAAGVPAAPPAVRKQAEALRARLGEARDDVVVVVDGEQPEQRGGIVREELAHWVDAGAAERRAGAGAWIDAQLARPAAAVELAEAWVGGLLELPPDDMETVIRAVVEALRERDADAQGEFRMQVSRASVRFHVPQFMRLRDTFNRISVELGEEPAWR